MSKERKHYTAEDKVTILRRRLLDKVPASNPCEALGLGGEQGRAITDLFKTPPCFHSPGERSMARRAVFFLSSI